MPKYECWSSKEIEIMKEYYPVSTLSELQRLLPKRSTKAINARASLLGIKKKPEIISQAIRESRLGMKASLETRHKLSQAKKGKMPANLATFAYKGKVPWNKGIKGVYESPHKGKTLEEIVGPDRARELKEYQRKIQTGKKMSSEAIQKHSDKMRGDLNPSKRPEVREKLSKTRREIIANGWHLSPEAIEKIREARRKQKFPISRTKPEMIFLNICEELDLPFRYVGDGSLWVGGLNPDFISSNNAIIVEIYGEYWHKIKPNLRCVGKPKVRWMIYRRLGYKSVSFWDYELKNKEEAINIVLNKLMPFSDLLSCSEDELREIRNKIIQEKTIKDILVSLREICFNHLRIQRWNKDIECPYCYSKRIYRGGYVRKGSQKYQCQDCNVYFNDLTNTIFEKHVLPLSDMLYILAAMDIKPAYIIASELRRSYTSIDKFIHQIQGENMKHILNFVPQEIWDLSRKKYVE